MDEDLEPNSPSSLWSGSMTPPLDELRDDLENEEEASQCIVSNNNISVESRPFSQDGHFTADTKNPLISSEDTNQESKEIIFLQCNSDHMGETFNCNTYLKSCILKRFIDNEFPYNKIVEQSQIELFGLKLVYSNYSALIKGLRQSIQRTLTTQKGSALHACAIDSNFNTYKGFIKDLKDVVAVVTFWLYRFARVKDYDVSSIVSSFDYSSFEQNVILEFHGLVTFTRSIFRKNSSSTCMNPSKDALLHIYLNTVLYYQCFLGIIIQREKFNDSSKAAVLLLRKSCYTLMGDVVELCHKRFRLGFSMEILFRASPFPCECVKEVVIINNHIRDHFSAKERLVFPNASIDTRSSDDTKQDLQQPFFSALFSIIEDFELDSCTKIVEYTTHDGADLNTFQLWLLKAFTEVLRYDQIGRIKEINDCYGSWTFLCQVVDDIFKDDGKSFLRRRGKELLRYSLHFMDAWKSVSKDFILKLWDHVQKNLDSTFSPQDSTITGSMMPSFTPQEWICKCRAYKTLTGIENDNVFDLFLRNLVKFMMRPDKNGGFTDWDYAKARFYSKFHRKRMQEFGEIGLHNFITMFLTLVCQTKQESTGKKMASFLSFVSEDTTMKRELVIKASFALLFVLKEENLDTTWLSEKLRDKFKDMCLIFRELPVKGQKRYDCLRLIWLYLNSVETLVYGAMSLGADAVLLDSDEVFNVLFQQTSNVEFQKLADVVQSFLRSQTLQPQNQAFNKNLLVIMCEKIYPEFEKVFNQRLKEAKLIDSIADLAAGFTKLTVNCAVSGVNTTLNHDRLLKTYLSSGLDSRFLVHYIPQILQSKQSIEMFVGLGLQGMLINTWFRLSIQFSTDKATFDELTSAVAELPEVKTGIEKDVRTTQTETNREGLILSFIVALGKQYNSLSLLQDILGFKRKLDIYFEGISKCLEATMQPDVSPMRIRYSYMLCGTLIRRLSRALYSKTVPDCLLPKLLDIMILPLVLSSKPIEPIHQKYIQFTLHEILIGLSALDFKRDEFIKRKIKEIFTRYFLPITEVALRSTLEKNPSTEASDFRDFIIQLVCQHFLVMPQPPSKLRTTLSFIQVLFERTQSEKEIHRNAPVVLNRALGCLIACDVCQKDEEPPDIRPQVMAILRVIARCFSSGDTGVRKELVACLEDFLSCNISRFQDSVFKTYSSFLALLPCAIEELDTFILEAIQTEEAKQEGTKGVSLRNCPMCNYAFGAQDHSVQ